MLILLSIQQATQNEENITRDQTPRRTSSGKRRSQINGSTTAVGANGILVMRNMFGRKVMRSR